MRTEREHGAGHIEGSVNVPLSRLRERIADVPADRRIVTLCSSGYRASIAASLLQREGREVADLAGGHGAWAAMAEGSG